GPERGRIGFVFAAPPQGRVLSGCPHHGYAGGGGRRRLRHGREAARSSPDARGPAPVARLIRDSMTAVQFRPRAHRRPSAEPSLALGGSRVYLDSLGCAKNLVDSEATLGLLVAQGAKIVFDAADADVLVVNTCGFLDSAREESIERILELAQLKSTARPRL